MSAGDLCVVELEPDGARGRVVALVRVLARRRHNLVAVRPERQPERLHLRCGRYMQKVCMFLGPDKPNIDLDFGCSTILPGLKAALIGVRYLEELLKSSSTGSLSWGAIQ